MADLLSRAGAFTSRVAALPTDGDVILSDRLGLGIATVTARGALSAIGGLGLPLGPAAAFAGGTTIIATGPATWLMLREEAPAGWAGSLERELGGAASVVDQSCAYAVLRLGGAGARRLLARGAFLDFHPDTFRAGSAAVTLIAHMEAIVWQRDDAPTYEVAVFRSYAGSFWHWIERAASGFHARLAGSVTPER